MGEEPQARTNVSDNGNVGVPGKALRRYAKGPFWKRRRAWFSRAPKRWRGTFVHGRVPIIDPLARARVPAKARLVAATLIFPGVFARTSVIIDRRPIRADPPLRT